MQNVTSMCVAGLVLTCCAVGVELLSQLRGAIEVDEYKGVQPPELAYFLEI